MDKEIVNVKFTKELYIEVAADKASQITSIKEEKDGVIAEITRRLEYLKELRRALREVKSKIKIEKNALRENKNRKFALTRKLSIQNRYAKNLNKAFSHGEENIDLTKFYTVEEQKTR